MKLTAVPLPSVLAVPGVQVVGLEAIVLPVEEVRAVRRDAVGVAADLLALHHQRALAGGGVDAIEVRRRALLLVHVAALVAADRPLAVRRDIEVTHRFVGELDEA